MVHFRAPKPRHREAKIGATTAEISRHIAKANHAGWTHDFRQASANRTLGKLGIWTLAACAFLLQGGATSRLSAAEAPIVSSQPSPSPVSSSTTPATAASSSQPNNPAAPVSTTAAAGEQHGPAPEISIPAAAANLAVVATNQSQVQSASANAPVALTQSSQPPASKTTPAWNPNAVWIEPAKATPAAGATAPTASTIAPVQDAPEFQVHLIDSGQTRQVSLAVKPNLTVGQTLGIIGVALGALDRVTPATSAPVQNGMVIKISRTTCETRVHNEYVPATVRYKPTAVLPAGAVQVIRYPQPGVIQVTENVWKHDGHEIGTQLVSRQVTAWPVAGVIGLGAWAHLVPNASAPRYQFALSYRGGSYRDRLLAGRSAQAGSPQQSDDGTLAPVRTVIVTATGYTAAPGGGCMSSRTATGVLCTYGAVAVDPRVIPLGSKLYIEGYGYGLACDTGGAIRGHRVDLAFDNVYAARREGRRVTRAYILAP